MAQFALRIDLPEETHPAETDITSAYDRGDLKDLIMAARKMMANAAGNRHAERAIEIFGDELDRVATNCHTRRLMKADMVVEAIRGFVKRKIGR